MSSRPNSEVRIWSIVDRRGASGYKARPWVVRWKVDGNQFSRGHRTRSEADHFRSGLLAAQRNGERFDGTSGEPLSWAASGEIKIHDWVRRWVGEQWPEWQPRTRNSAVEALSRFVPLVVRSGSPPADGLRIYLVRALRVDGEGQDDRLEAWMNRWCLDLSDLDRQLLATVEQKLVTGLDGKPLAQTTASRYRNTAKGCIQRAVDLELDSCAIRGRRRRRELDTVRRGGRAKQSTSGSCLIPPRCVELLMRSLLINQRVGATS